jgi:hypothetical protein
MTNPPLIQVRQEFPSSKLDDVPAAVRSSLDTCGARPARGARIAVAVGSRGIRNLAAAVAETIVWLRAQGAEPFIFPAMGSHGGATADGQERVLRGLGITAETVGAPIQSSMEVVEITPGAGPVRLFMDRMAWESDGIVLINRVKPHTSFHGSVESGLLKMAVIGVGKHDAALEIHRFGVRGLCEFLAPAWEGLQATGKFLLGIAMLENAYDETMRVQAVPARDIARIEPELLEIARANMPSLPVEEIDVLIVDEMGKDISGTGMDPNIIGRLRIAGQPEPASPRITSLIVTDVTEASKGSIYGVGLADVITRRLLSKADLDATYQNARTSTFLERAKIPYTAATPRDALEVALRACGSLPEGWERIVRIRNTLEIRDVYLSPGLLADARNPVVVMSPAKEMFLPNGELCPFSGIRR